MPNLGELDRDDPEVKKWLQEFAEQWEVFFGLRVNLSEVERLIADQEKHEVGNGSGS